MPPTHPPTHPPRRPPHAHIAAVQHSFPCWKLPTESMCACMRSGLLTSSSSRSRPCFLRRLRLSSSSASSMRSASKVSCASSKGLLRPGLLLVPLLLLPLPLLVLLLPLVLGAGVAGAGAGAAAAPSPSPVGTGPSAASAHCEGRADAEPARDVGGLEGVANLLAGCAARGLVPTNAASIAFLRPPRPHTPPPITHPPRSTIMSNCLRASFAPSSWGSPQEAGLRPAGSTGVASRCRWCALHAPAVGAASDVRSPAAGERRSVADEARCMQLSIAATPWPPPESTLGAGDGITTAPAGGGGAAGGAWLRDGVSRVPTTREHV